jgi:Lar family restriction alleviation protein
METVELKRCPFCGADAFIHYPTHNTVAVLCGKWGCGATISVGDARRIDEVIDRWNRRADDERNNE